MCLYPKLIFNRKYTKTKKNGGKIPSVSDERVLKVPVGCGKCMECRAQKAREWHVRLMEDTKHNRNGKFVTLTFSNEAYAKLAEEIEAEGYDLDNEIATVAMRRFLERWRKKYKKSLRHWFITELGHQNTEHLHLHGIVWIDEKIKGNHREILRDIWQYGYIYPRNDQQWTNSYVNEKTATYITKYLNKTDNDHKEYIPKMLTSAGIGKGYVKTHNAKLNKYKGKETKETYTTKSGHQMALPIYYRNHLYSEEERERLWLNKLDEQVRYVGGQKIDVSKDERLYWMALESARKKNKRLGYGDDTKDWSRANYEHEMRKLAQHKRGVKK